MKFRSLQYMEIGGAMAGGEYHFIECLERQDCCQDEEEIACRYGSSPIDCTWVNEVKGAIRRWFKEVYAEKSESLLFREWAINDRVIFILTLKFWYPEIWFLSPQRSAAGEWEEKCGFDGLLMGRSRETVGMKRWMNLGINMRNIHRMREEESLHSSNKDWWIQSGVQILKSLDKQLLREGELDVSEGISMIPPSW